MNAEFKRQLQAINYSVFEEEGSISGHKDLGDRLLLLDLSDVERCYACNTPGAQLHAYLSFHALREVEEVILRPIGLSSLVSQHARRHLWVARCGDWLDGAMNEAEDWGRSIRLNQLLDSLAVERPDGPSIPQINHLVALAFLGRFDTLEDYADSFAKGRNLNFVPMITKAVIDAARGVAYEHYVAK